MSMKFMNKVSDFSQSTYQNRSRGGFLSEESRCRVRFHRAECTYIHTYIYMNIYVYKLVPTRAEWRSRHYLTVALLTQSDRFCRYVGQIPHANGFQIQHRSNRDVDVGIAY